MSLSDAISQNNTKLVKELLANKFFRDRVNEVDQGTNSGSGGHAPLHIAAMKGCHTSIIEALLKAGANIDQPDNHGDTPLSLAAQKGKIEAIQALLKGGANINHRSTLGWTPLSGAVYWKQIKAIQILLKLGADVNLPDEYAKTPLHAAVSRFDTSVEIIQELLKAGARVDQPNEVVSNWESTYTPLQTAVAYGQVNAIYALLKGGAKIDQANNHGQTALYIAAANGKVEVAQILLKAGAAVNLPDKVGKTPLHAAAQQDKVEAIKLLIKEGAIIEQTDKDGKTPLCIAAEEGKVEAIQALFRAGAKVNPPNNSPLHAAALKGKVDAIQTLLQVGGNVNQPNNRGETPFYIAVYNGQMEAIQHLLKAGAKIDQPDMNGDTPLYAAARRGQIEAIQFLLQAGATVNQANNHGDTPLHGVALSGREEAIQHLLKAGAKVDATDNDGGTPLFNAAQNGQVKVIQTLLKNGVNINHLNKDEETPLYKAALNGRVEAIQVLLQAGANIHAKTKEGKTSLDIAKEKGHTAIVKLFEEEINKQLYIAAQEGKVETLRTLLKAGAQINQPTNDGMTPLLIATEKGQVEVVQVLLQAGANIHAKTKEGKTSLDIAKEKGHTAIVKLFEEEINKQLYIATQEGKAETLRTLLKAGAQIDQPTNDGMTPLLIATEKGQVEVVQVLLQAGANIHAKTKEGKTSLDIAKEKGHTIIVKLFEEEINKQLYIATQEGKVETLRTLLKNGANVNHLNKDEETPLYKAVLNGQVEAIQVLLQVGANIHAKTKEGKTSLDIAKEKGHTAIVKLFEEEINKQLYIATQEGKVETLRTLLKAGAQIDQPTNDGMTPLLIATEKGQVEVVQVLLQAGANIHAKTKEGKTSLDIAKEKGHTAIVKLFEEEINKQLYIATQEGKVETLRTLLKAGAQIDQPTNDGMTPLLIATEKGQVEVVQVLLQAGANIHAKTKEGKTSLDIAKEKGHTIIVKLFEITIINLFEGQIKLNQPQNVYPSPLISNPLKNSSLDLKDAVDIFSFTLKYSELEIGKELGRGGFGVVYQGTWKKHIEVAVKQLHLAKPSENTLREFKQEMEIMSRLRCPQIIQLYGVYTEPNYGIVMEYMPNGSLYQVLHNKQPLEWSVRTSIAVDITKGVAFLHSENILHRDLKSLNVLLDKYMKAKLTDFGLAKVKTETASITSSSNNNNQVAGTLLWMAPELFKRKAQCTQKSDMYSLGMTLWELASREIPFKDASNQAIARDWIEKGEREEIPKDCPPKISKLITFCWNAEAEKRPTADEAVKQLLSAELKQEQEETSNFSYRGNFDSGFK